MCSERGCQAGLARKQLQNLWRQLQQCPACLRYRRKATQGSQHARRKMNAVTRLRLTTHTQWTWRLAQAHTTGTSLLAFLQGFWQMRPKALQHHCTALDPQAKQSALHTLTSKCTQARTAQHLPQPSLGCCTPGRPLQPQRATEDALPTVTVMDKEQAGAKPARAAQHCYQTLLVDTQPGG